MQHINSRPETWKPVVGYEESYEVSDRGRVRSVDRVITQKTGQTYWVKGKILTPHRQESGHLRFGASRGGKARAYLVHRAVLEAFVGPCPEGMEACHNDGNPSNNRLENLRWDTFRENNLDRVRMNTHNNTRKTECPIGHRLIEPNLIPSSLKVGQRACLACNRTHAYQRLHPELKPRFQELADSRYRKIMNIL